MGTKKTALAKRGGKVVSAGEPEKVVRVVAPVPEANPPAEDEADNDGSLGTWKNRRKEYPDVPFPGYPNAVRVQLLGDVDQMDEDRMMNPIATWLLPGDMNIVAEAVVALNALAARFAHAYAEQLRALPAPVTDVEA